MIIGDASCTAARTSSRDRGALLELALDATKTGFFTWDVAEDRGDPDDRFAALFGVSSGGRLDLKSALATMIHPADRERYAGGVARTVDPSGDGKFDEGGGLSLSGVERWVAISGVSSSRAIRSVPYA